MNSKYNEFLTEIAEQIDAVLFAMSEIGRSSEFTLTPEDDDKIMENVNKAYGLLQCSLSEALKARK